MFNIGRFQKSHMWLCSVGDPNPAFWPDLDLAILTTGISCSRSDPIQDA
jgi:hypothetical protein